MKNLPHNWIRPEWPAPNQVQACVTTRLGGESQSPYVSFNVAEHVGDSAESVLLNRRRLVEKLVLPAEPQWLSQIHSNRIVKLSEETNGLPEADASFTCESGIVCAVLTADCLPVMFTDYEGSCVAVAHAGWRGLVAGILEAIVTALPADPDKIMAWMGPAIGPLAFEVGDEVRQVFSDKHSNTNNAFRATNNGLWLADIYQLASRILKNVGVNNVFGGGYCTYTDEQRFFSYRREKTTGRMASLIWLSSR
jgi:YfiH family protein